MTAPDLSIAPYVCPVESACAPYMRQPLTEHFDPKIGCEVRNFNNDSRLNRQRSLTMPAAVDGQPIQMQNGRLVVPDRPIIPFIEGDGTGPDIWRASQRVFDAAVEKAYGGKRQIAWQEVLAGQKSFDKSATGCPTKRSTRSASCASASRARSRRRSAAASARSTSRCGNCSTCSSACGRCATSKACPARCASRSWSTW